MLEARGRYQSLTKLREVRLHARHNRAKTDGLVEQTEELALIIYGDWIALAKTCNNVEHALFGTAIIVITIDF